MATHDRSGDLETLPLAQLGPEFHRRADVWTSTSGAGCSRPSCGASCRASPRRRTAAEPKAEAKRKDEVEDALHEAACVRHTIPLAAAQAAIARNWTQTPVGRLPAIRERRRYPEDER
jgi:predicted nucleic acid-binding Zn ribbon protein